jgi:hypothetical protein
MRKLAERQELIWMSKKITIPLVLAGFVLAAWSSYAIPDPGIAIGLLGSVAGVMSLRPSMHFAEKMSWLVVLVCLATAEIRSIHISARENTDRNQAILDSMTGGNSYDVIMPALVFEGPDKAELPLMITVRGKNALWDVRVEMAEGPLDVRYEASHSVDYFAGKLRTSANLGTVSTTYMRPTGLLIRPSADKINTYLFWTRSRNEMTREELGVRWNKERSFWELAWKIYRESPDVIEEVDYGESKARMFPRKPSK